MNSSYGTVVIGDVSGNWHEGRAVAKAGGLASISIPEVPASPGKQVTVPLVVDSLSGNVYSADVVISYDATVMTAVSVSKSGPWGSLQHRRQPHPTRKDTHRHGGGQSGWCGRRAAEAHL